MPLLESENTEIYYEEYGSGYPILLFAPGGMWSQSSRWHDPVEGPPRVWNDWTIALAENHRVIAMDQRNAGRSRAPIEADHGWHSYAADHLALMDHLGFDRFNILGGCIGSSFCLKLCEIAPDRINAAVLQNPIGLNPEAPTYFPDHFAQWSEEQQAQRPELDAAAVASFGRNMWGGEFVFCVDRNFVKSCQTPCLVLPGNDTPHPHVVGLEVADLLPNSERLVDWKGPEHKEEQLHRVTGFLAAHTP